MKTCMSILIAFLNQYSQSEISHLYNGNNIAFAVWARAGNDLRVLHAGKAPRGKNRWKTKVSCTYADKIYKVYEYREKL